MTIFLLFRKHNFGEKKISEWSFNNNKLNRNKVFSIIHFYRFFLEIVRIMKYNFHFSGIDNFYYLTLHNKSFILLININFEIYSLGILCSKNEIFRILYFQKKKNYFIFI